MSKQGCLVLRCFAALKHLSGRKTKSKHSVSLEIAVEGKKILFAIYHFHICGCDRGVYVKRETLWAASV